MNKGYIYSSQLPIQGRRKVIGFQITDTISLRLIERDISNKLISENHYSHTVVSNSYLYLGVFNGKDLIGSLQYGYAMNPASGKNIVPDISNKDYLELNRMWIADAGIDYIESQCVSASIKIIKSLYPNVCFIQSFADERCRLFGVVYQACSFGYYGEHTTEFYEHNGVWFHKIVASGTKKAGANRLKDFAAVKDEIKQVKLRQFRYLKFLKPWAEKKCTLKKLDYPKPLNLV